MKINQLLYDFETHIPEIIFEWSDTESDAVGWVVVNSLRGGAAGGGTRMRLGLDKSEVIALAKTMEIKFSIAGPAIGGANVPFSDKEIFYSPIAQYLDRKLTLIPDIIANCGMARVFSYLMSGDVVISDEAIFADISETIKQALDEIDCINSNKTEITASAYKIALNKLGTKNINHDIKYNLVA